MSKHQCLLGVPLGQAADFKLPAKFWEFFVGWKALESKANLGLKTIEQPGFRLNRQGEPLPADHGNFVRQQNGYGRQRDPGGQSVASEEVQGHAYPAKADSY